MPLLMVCLALLCLGAQARPLKQVIPADNENISRIFWASENSLVLWGPGGIKHWSQQTGVKVLSTSSFWSVELVDGKIDAYSGSGHQSWTAEGEPIPSVDLTADSNRLWFSPVKIRGFVSRAPAKPYIVRSLPRGLRLINASTGAYLGLLEGELKSWSFSPSYDAVAGLSATGIIIWDLQRAPTLDVITLQRSFLITSPHGT